MTFYIQYFHTVHTFSCYIMYKIWTSSIEVNEPCAKVYIPESLTTFFFFFNLLVQGLEYLTKIALSFAACTRTFLTWMKTILIILVFWHTFRSPCNKISWTGSNLSIFRCMWYARNLMFNYVAIKLMQTEV